MAGRAHAISVNGERRGYFEDDDAYKTFRVIARNRALTGETEGFGFSNGIATISGLPRNVKHIESRCGGEDGLCRYHERLFRLNNLMNYPAYEREVDERTNRKKTVRYEGYRVLTDEAYEREFGDADEPEPIDLQDL